VDAREGSVTTVARKRVIVGLAARRDSDSGSARIGREDAGGDGNGTRRGAVEGCSVIWSVPGTAGGRIRLVRRLVQAGRAGDAGRDAGARRSARPLVGLVLWTLERRSRTRRGRETKNLLKERNKVQPRPCSTARTSGDSTRTPSGSTSASSTSSSSSTNSSTLGRTSVSRTTRVNTPSSSNSSSSSSVSRTTSSNSSSSSSSSPRRTGSASTARSSSRTSSRANSSSLSSTTRSSSSSTARMSTPRFSSCSRTSSSSSTTPEPGKPLA
ncbi:unnamed protein product, partial [Closterium sp. NIES-53]